MPGTTSTALRGQTERGVAVLQSTSVNNKYVVYTKRSVALYFVYFGGLSRL